MYKAEITETIKELTVKERISFTEGSNTISLDEAIKAAENNNVVIKPVNIVALHIINDASEDKEYERYLFVSEIDEVYSTGSKSAYETARNIISAIEQAEKDGESVGEWALEFFKKESKNNQNPFITCRLI